MKNEPWGNSARSPATREATAAELAVSSGGASWQGEQGAVRPTQGVCSTQVGGAGERSRESGGGSPALQLPVGQLQGPHVSLEVTVPHQQSL